MAGQSLAMGEAFGKGFQYGKRKISSMSNEDFNKMDFKELSESLATDYRVMIPSLQRSIEASDELQKSVFRAFGDILGTIPEVIKEFMSQGQSSTTSTSASALGELYDVRYTPSHDREGDLEKTNAALAAAKKALEDAYAFAASMVTKDLPPSTTQDAIKARAKLEQSQRIRQSATKEAQLNIQRARQPVVASTRAAGQSQRMELKKLQKKMQQDGLMEIGWKRLVAKAPISAKRGGTDRATRQKQLDVIQARIRGTQISIENLMKRYRF